MGTQPIGRFEGTKRLEATDWRRGSGLMLGLMVIQDGRYENGAEARMDDSGREAEFACRRTHLVVVRFMRQIGRYVSDAVFSDEDTHMRVDVECRYIGTFPEKICWLSISSTCVDSRI